MYEIIRKVGDTIEISGDIRITILNIEGLNTRFAVYDPKGRVATCSEGKESNHHDLGESGRTPLISGY